jgi:hypothetical protein
MKFSFRKVIQAGKWRSFQEECHEIKLNKKVVGRIKWSREDGLFLISLVVKKNVTKEDPASFKWITLKGRYNTAEEARQMLGKNIDIILQRYNLYSFEEYVE